MPDRTSLSHFLLEQSVNKQALTQNEMIAVRLFSGTEVQMIQSCKTVLYR